MNYKTYYPDEVTLSKMTSMASVDAIIVHHSASGPGTTVEDIRKWHVVERASEGYLWIGYHFVIYQNGEVIQTRPINKRGGHCPEKGYNTRSIGICLIGNFENETPSVAQWTAYKSLASDLLETLQISQVISHSEAKGGTTACPGAHVLNLLKSTSYKSSEIPSEPVSFANCSCTLSAYPLEELINEVHKRIQLKHYD